MSAMGGGGQNPSALGRCKFFWGGKNAWNFLTYFVSKITNIR